MNSIQKAGTSDPVNVRQFIDERTFSRYQFQVIALCALVLFLDGFDTQAIGYVAPAIIKSMGISHGALSPVFSASLIGLTLGALLGGPLSDRFGRRPILLCGLIVFGIMSLLTAGAGSVNSLLILRLLTGLGLGCVMPNAIALTSEFAPARNRSTAVMVMFCGFSLGAALGGVAAAVLIVDFGWRSVFIVGGILPCLASIVLWKCLPESVRFLVMRGGNERVITATLHKIDGAFDTSRPIQFVADDDHYGKSPVKQLFAERRTLLTLLLWVIFFMGLMDLYFLSNWLPTILNDAGLAVDSAALITAMFQVGGTIGTLVLGRLFDRVPPFKALAAIYCIAALFIVMVGSAGHSIPLLVSTIFGAGFCVVGGQIGANALAAQSYPTAIRATGVGWSLGIGRIGSIIGPIVGGVLLASQWAIHDIFYIAAVPVGIACIAALVVSRYR